MKSKLYFCLVALFSFTSAFAQQRTITGRVTAPDGSSLAGVTVAQKGTQNAAVTNDQGQYSLAVTGSQVTLVFTSVGSKSQEVNADNLPVVNVTLQASITTLGDVVVVGYGSSSRKNLSSAITTVKPDDLNKGAITDVGQLLQGKVPGLNITASGDPNKPAAVILRGASTLNSSQSPFYVIDGVPGADISTVAPDDIASVDVLKDAAAAAIYGNRAANGVIMITTKRGKRDEQAQVSYNGYVAMEKVSNELDMMNATELRDFLSKNNLSFSPADDGGANTDWQKAIQRDQAISFNHNISVSGGGKHNDYSASINYARKEGILQTSNLTRVIARLAMDQYFIDDKVKLGFTLSNSNSNADNVPIQNAVLLQSVQYLPVTPIKNQDGNYSENFATTGYFNPVALINNAQDNTKSNNLIGSLTAHVQLPFGLTYDLNLSYQSYTTLHGEYYNSYYSRYNSAQFYNNYDPPGVRTLLNFGTNGSALRNTYQNTSKVLETFFTWDRKFGAHSINAVLGYSWQGNVSGEGFQATSTNFPVDNTSFYNLSLSNPYAISSYRIDFGDGNIYQESRLISDFARLNYSYNDKYLLQASLRRDGSSVFGTNHQWGYFPAVGAAWRISQEGFMSSSHLFDDLKLRASYGVTGNATGFDAYTAQVISGSLGSFYSNGQLLNAYGPTQAANPDLRWEKTATFNIGVDFSVLDGRLSGSVDWYDKNTTGMIYGYNVDPTIVPTGSITANGGSMNNRGIELNISATPVSHKDFNWNFNLGLSHNRNEIVSLTNSLFSGGDSVRINGPSGQGQTGSTLQILKAGKPLGEFFSLEYAGKDQNGVSQYVDAQGNLTTVPAIGADYHYLGSPQPKIMMGFSNSFRYKNFDLNIFIRGVFGDKIFNATRADLFRPSTAQYTNILRDVAGESMSDVNSYKYSSRFIEDGTYVRLDNGTLGYNFKHLIRYVENVRVYVSVNNLFTITKYNGIDPEINQGGIQPGVDSNNFYPKTTTFLFGLNVSF